MLDRRELLKAALAVPGIQTIEKIQANKDEVFVISVDHKLSSEEAHRIYHQWETTFEKSGMTAPPVIVLEKGISLSVARVK